MSTGRSIASTLASNGRDPMPACVGYLNVRIQTHRFFTGGLPTTSDLRPCADVPEHCVTHTDTRRKLTALAMSSIRFRKRIEFLDDFRIHIRRAVSPLVDHFIDHCSCSLDTDDVVGGRLRHKICSASCRESFSRFDIASITATPSCANAQARTAASASLSFGLRCTRETNSPSSTEITLNVSSSMLLFITVFTPADGGARHSVCTFCRASLWRFYHKQRPTFAPKTIGSRYFSPSMTGRSLSTQVNSLQKPPSQ